MNQAKNIQFIWRRVVKFVLGLLAVFWSVAIFRQEWTWIYSTALGTFFSALIYTQLIKTQVEILKKRRPALFMAGYLTRMFLYAVPVFLGLWQKAYFNLPLILVSLFTFHLSVMGFELLRNVKHFRQRT